jgi:hypothetical protein
MDVVFFESHARGSTSEKYSDSLQTRGHAVLRYAPKSTNSNERTANFEKGKTQNISANAEANLKVGSKGAGTGINFERTKGTTETYKHHYFETCRSHTRGRLLTSRFYEEASVRGNCRAVAFAISYFGGNSKNTSSFVGSYCFQVAYAKSSNM